MAYIQYYELQISTKDIDAHIDKIIEKEELLE